MPKRSLRPKSDNKQVVVLCLIIKIIIKDHRTFLRQKESHPNCLDKGKVSNVSYFKIKTKTYARIY